MSTEERVETRAARAATQAYECAVNAKHSLTADAATKNREAAWAFVAAGLTSLIELADTAIRRRDERDERRSGLSD